MAKQQLLDNVIQYMIFITHMAALNLMDIFKAKAKAHG
jgi:hypothetical protein